jgi:hypothetical protein
MALRSASPWWLSIVYLVGLVFLFLGQRAFASVEGVSILATLLGAVMVVGVTAFRVYITLNSRGGRRKVERTILWTHLGAGLALLLYAFTTKLVTDKLGGAGWTEAGMAKYQTVMLVLWGLVLLVSLTVLLMIEVTQGGYSLRVIDWGGRRHLTVHMNSAERAKFSEDDDQDVEHLRVRDAAWSGLSIGLAASFLLVTCQVAAEKNVRRDVSYFKTSAPGESTQKIVKNKGDQLKVLLFFPDVNEVKDEVRGYFDTLAAETGKIEITEHNYMDSRKLAEKYGVSKHGVILIAKGDLAVDDPDPKVKAQTEKIDMDTDIDRARRGKGGKLRNLDREVNSALLKLVREKRIAYLTVGHGELNDYESVSPEYKNGVPERRTSALKKRLGELNYEAKELGLIDLMQGVPDDATIVMMLAPTQPLTPEELNALDRYVEKGGRMLVAMDPYAKSTLGPLEGRFGVTFDKTPITDDKYNYRQLGTPADRRWAVTSQFSAHASTTTMSRSVDKGLLLVDSGSLKDAPFTHDADKTKRTYVIRSMTSSWLDVVDNLSFDEGAEKRDRYNVGAAIEGPKLKAEDGTDKDGFRAVVYADADLFADLTAVNLGNYAVLSVTPVPAGYQTQQLGLTSGPLIEDAVKWLGGEEVLAGEVVSEEDVVPIKHDKDSKGKDTRWFLGMIGGVPALVLVTGLIITGRLKKRRSRKSAEATS